MKEIDDTKTPPMLTLVELFDRVFELEKRIANLETQRTPQDNNEDDAEWY